MQRALGNLRAFVARVEEPGSIVARRVVGVDEGLMVKTRNFDGVNLELVKTSDGRRHADVDAFLNCVSELKNVCANTPSFA
jgi:hypothetical protein